MNIVQTKQVAHGVVEFNIQQPKHQPAVASAPNEVPTNHPISTGPAPEPLIQHATVAESSVDHAE